MKKMSGKKRIIISLMLASLFFIAFGCAGSTVKKDSEAKESPPENPEPGHAYHDFADVLIPAELQVRKNESFISQTPGFAGGLMVLSGRVEIDSLTKFFVNNMTKDNWKNVSSLKYRPVIMLFRKENRNCVIRIEEQNFDTRVEIWVAPNLNSIE